MKKFLQTFSFILVLLSTVWLILGISICPQIIDDAFSAIILFVMFGVPFIFFLCLYLFIKKKFKIFATDTAKSETIFLEPPNTTLSANVSDDFNMMQSQVVDSFQTQETKDISPSEEIEPTIKPNNTTTSILDSYIVLDVETPNRNNNRISQIGLIEICNGTIKNDYSSLINPETGFDQINTKLTNISSEDVMQAPTFIDYWPRIKTLFESNIVVAHNASFDLNVLYKTLFHYKIEFPKIQYICTYEQAMKDMMELPKYSLADLSKHFGILQDNAHNAHDDAYTCHQIFEKMKISGLIFSPKLFIAPDISVLSEADKLVHEPNPNKDNLTVEIPYSEPSRINIKEQRFVLTGIFSTIPRKDFISYIENNGGTVTSSVSGRTNYLLVGNKPEPAWAHGNYGKKIEKAIDLRNQGKENPIILKESHFVKCFNINKE